MATIVNTPGDRDDSSAGWAVAVIILLVVIAGIAFWYARYHRAPAQGGGANIQVNLPTAGNGGGSGSGGGGGGGSAPAAGQ
jgi:hypothetical protein